MASATADLSTTESPPESSAQNGLAGLAADTGPHQNLVIEPMSPQRFQRLSTQRLSHQTAINEGRAWEALNGPDGFLVGTFARGSGGKQRFAGDKAPRTIFRVYRSGITSDSVLDRRSASCPSLAQAARQNASPEETLKKQQARLREVRQRGRVSFDPHSGLAVLRSPLRWQPRHYGSDFVEQPVAQFEFERLAVGTLRDVNRLFDIYRVEVDVVAFICDGGQPLDENERVWRSKLALSRAELIVRSMEGLGAPRGYFRAQIGEQGPGVDVCFRFRLDVSAGPTQQPRQTGKEEKEAEEEDEEQPGKLLVGRAPGRGTPRKTSRSKSAGRLIAALKAAPSVAGEVRTSPHQELTQEGGVQEEKEGEAVEEEVEEVEEKVEEVKREAWQEEVAGTCGPGTGDCPSDCGSSA